MGSAGERELIGKEVVVRNGVPLRSEKDTVEQETHGPEHADDLIHLYRVERIDASRVWLIVAARVELYRAGKPYREDPKVVP